VACCAQSLPCVRVRQRAACAFHASSAASGSRAFVVVCLRAPRRRLLGCARVPSCSLQTDRQTVGLRVRHLRAVCRQTDRVCAGRDGGRSGALCALPNGRVPPGDAGAGGGVPAVSRGRAAGAAGVAGVAGLATAGLREPRAAGCPRPTRGAGRHLRYGVGHPEALAVPQVPQRQQPRPSFVPRLARRRKGVCARRAAWGGTSFCWPCSQHDDSGARSGAPGKPGASARARAFVPPASLFVARAHAHARAPRARRCPCGGR
jgi:hypothetical protein